MGRQWLMTGLLLLLTAGCLTQQERAQRRAETQRALNEAIASRQLRIGITSMSTLRYGSRTVMSDFFLELRGDTLQSYLPYLGQAHTAPMSTPAQGLNFKERMDGIEESSPKAGMTRYVIGVRTQEDRYRYVIEVYDTGEAAIRVSSHNRDPISFGGHCVFE